MKITVDQIMSWEPCAAYPRERVESLIGDGKTLDEFASLNSPAADRVWGLIHLMDNRQRRLLACACARSVLPIYDAAYPGDMRPRNAIDVAERYARDEATEEDLSAARAAADAAARAAYADARAAYAAYYAARAAYAAARAAYAAARAAYAAARAAADAEREKQVRIAVEILNGWTDR